MIEPELDGAGHGRHVAVLGLGNVLQGDDALGPYVVEMLRVTYDFPDGVSVIDAGTPGLDLTPYIAGLDALIVVDAVRASGAAGELRSYRRAELLEKPPPQRLSPHDPGLKECLLTLELVGQSPPEVLLVGLIPDAMLTDTGLSAAVRAGVPRVEAVVVDELARLGLAPSRRKHPDDPDLWWERQP